MQVGIQPLCHRYDGVPEKVVYTPVASERGKALKKIRKCSMLVRKFSSPRVTEPGGSFNWSAIYFNVHRLNIQFG